MFFVRALPQDCARRLADSDLAVRQQAEQHRLERDQLVQERDAARLAAGMMHASARASQKAVHSAIRSLDSVQQHVRLTQGAAQEVYRVSHSSVAAAPSEQRSALEAELKPPRMAMSSSWTGLAQSASQASSEIVAASVQVRQHDKRAQEAMGHSALYFA